MSGHLKAVIIILAVGLIAMLAYRFTWPYLENSLQTETSDAAVIKHRLRLGMDNWVGYFPMCSPEMQQRLRNRAIQLQCIDDKADYHGRFGRLDRHELELAVATADSYLLNGAEFDFPGVIVAVIDESKGGDAIVADTRKVASLSMLKNSPDLRVAFTPASPSEHLLKSIGAHFDIPWLKQKRGNWRLQTDGSSDALQQLRDKKADVAVLWEPDVSRAIADNNFGILISSKDTDKLIVDILLVDRRYLRDNPEVLQEFLQTYFDTLQYYSRNPDRLRGDLRETTALDDAQIDAMLGGVEWAGLTENAVTWFGVSGSGLYGDEAVIDAINASLDVLIESQDFDHNPLPEQNPYRLTNRLPIEKLYRDHHASGQQTESTPESTFAHRFTPLDEKAWQGLKEIGNLKVDAISFRRGSGALDLDGKQSLDKVAERLKRYPNFRILVKGHTGIRGDAPANLKLSAERAEAVTRYLLVTYNLDPNRILSLGYGGTAPLPKLPGESARAYSYRLPRVEIALVSEAY